MSHTPISIAAACVVICATIQKIHDIDRHTIASVFGISSTTLTKTINKLSEFYSAIFDDTIIIPTSIIPIKQLPSTCHPSSSKNIKLLRKNLYRANKTHKVSLDEIHNIHVHDFMSFDIIDFHQFLSYNHILYYNYYCSSVLEYIHVSK
jgi:hypothetical protein